MIKEEDWRARYHDSAVEKRRKKRRRQRRFRRFCTVLVVLALLTGWFFWQQEGLSTETITVESAPDGFSLSRRREVLLRLLRTRLLKCLLR